MALGQAHFSAILPVEKMWLTPIQPKEGAGSGIPGNGYEVAIFTSCVIFKIQKSLIMRRSFTLKRFPKWQLPSSRLERGLSMQMLSAIPSNLPLFALGYEKFWIVGVILLLPFVLVGIIFCVGIYLCSIRDRLTSFCFKNERNQRNIGICLVVISVSLGIGWVFYLMTIL